MFSQSSDGREAPGTRQAMPTIQASSRRRPSPEREDADEAEEAWPEAPLSKMLSPSDEASLIGREAATECIDILAVGTGEIWFGLMEKVRGTVDSKCGR